MEETQGLQNRLEAMEIVKKEAKDYYEKQDYEKALKTYERAGQYLGVLFKDEPQHADPIKLTLEMNIALCNFKLRKFSQSICHCDNVLQLDPKNIKACFRKAQCYYEQGQSELATREYMRILQWEPNHKETKLALQKLKQDEKKTFERETKMFASMFNNKSTEQVNTSTEQVNTSTEKPTTTTTTTKSFSKHQEYLAILLLSVIICVVYYIM